MRHGNTNKKFSRVRKVRIGFMRSLIVALIRSERMITTEARAKAVRPMIEKMVTQARTDTLATRRMLLSRLNNNTTLVNKLMTDIAPRYAKRAGGYTRIIKLPKRASDAAPMAVIQFV